VRISANVSIDIGFDSNESKNFMSTANQTMPWNPLALIADKTAPANKKNRYY
jgi:hypothetical protein